MPNLSAPRTRTKIGMDTTATSSGTIWPTTFRSVFRETVRSRETVGSDITCAPLRLGETGASAIRHQLQPTRHKSESERKSSYGVPQQAEIKVLYVSDQALMAKSRTGIRPFSSKRVLKPDTP